MPKALVTRATRRELQLYVDGGFVSGRTSTQALEISVGDQVEFETRSGLAFVSKILPRKNALSRMYRDAPKTLASNLDHVVIVAGAGPLFQPLFIDKVLAVCFHQAISCSLVVNKRDLGLDSIRELVSIYEQFQLPVIMCSAKYSQGLEQLEKLLCTPQFSIVAITGISGVGKSTILNNLIPDAERVTREVSSKSGLGRQTTSQAQGFFYAKQRERAPLLLIDLPGLQNFGVSHLTHFDVGASFPEIVETRSGCKYSDCLHRAENECAVKVAVNAGVITESRYKSYLKMLEEIDAAPRY